MDNWPEPRTMKMPPRFPGEAVIVLPDGGITCRKVTVPVPEGAVGISSPQAETSAMVIVPMANAYQCGFMDGPSHPFLSASHPLASKRTCGRSCTQDTPPTG